MASKEAKRRWIRTTEGKQIRPWQHEECPWCRQSLPEDFERPTVVDKDQPAGRYSTMTPDQARFYMMLGEALNKYHGFVNIPPKMKWNRWAGMFHLARAHHALQPERTSEEGWLVVVDMQAEWLMSCPPGFDVPGIPDIEKTRDVLRGLMKRIRGYAGAGEAEFGKIAVRQRQGYILIRHEGPVPELPNRKDLEEKLDRIGAFDLSEKNYNVFT